MKLILTILGLYFAYLFLKIFQENKLKWKAETTQEPSLNTDADWTLLDELAMDIARHESLARWHTEGRQLFRDIPFEDRNVEGGWQVFCDEWGEDIPDNYERIFREIRVLKPRQRARRLKIAERRSAPARAVLNAKPIILPDRSKTTLPYWMLATQEEIAKFS